MDKLLESCEFRPYKGFGDVERGEYAVKRFSVADTKYGHRVRVDLEEFYVYLPARFQALDFPKDRIDDLNLKDVILVFKGKEPGVNGRYVKHILCKNAA